MIAPVSTEAPVLGPTGRPMPDIPEPSRWPATATRSSSPCATRRAASARPRPRSTSGAALAEYGRKVLMVDFDPQASLTVGMGINPNDLDTTIYHVMMEQRRRHR